MRVPPQSPSVIRRAGNVPSSGGVMPSYCRWCSDNYSGGYNSACDDGRWILCVNLDNGVPYSQALENSYQYCRNQYNGLYETACIQGAQHCSASC